MIGPSPSTASHTITTDATGTACMDGLLFGSYTVTETVPNGYAADSTNPQTTTVATNTTCAGSPNTLNFHNTPLTDLAVTATSEVPGATNSTIPCVVAGSSTNIGNSPRGPVDPASVTAGGLRPGSYTCTVVIDP